MAIEAGWSHGGLLLGTRRRIPNGRRFASLNAEQGDHWTARLPSTVPVTS